MDLRSLNDRGARFALVAVFLGTCMRLAAAEDSEPSLGRRFSDSRVEHEVAHFSVFEAVNGLLARQGRMSIGTEKENGFHPTQVWNWAGRAIRNIQQQLQTARRTLDSYGDRVTSGEGRVAHTKYFELERNIERRAQTGRGMVYGEVDAPSMNATAVKAWWHVAGDLGKARVSSQLPTGAEGDYQDANSRLFLAPGKGGISRALRSADGRTMDHQRVTYLEGTLDTSRPLSKLSKKTLDRLKATSGSAVTLISRRESILTQELPSLPKESRPPATRETVKRTYRLLVKGWEPVQLAPEEYRELRSALRRGPQATKGVARPRPHRKVSH